MSCTRRCWKGASCWSCTVCILENQLHVTVTDPCIKQKTCSAYWHPKPNSICQSCKTSKLCINHAGNFPVIWPFPGKTETWIAGFGALSLWFDSKRFSLTLCPKAAVLRRRNWGWERESPSQSIKCWSVMACWGWEGKYHVRVCKKEHCLKKCNVSPPVSISRTWPSFGCYISGETWADWRALGENHWRCSEI